MVSRTLAKHLRALFRQYPVVTLTGPRQSGKTTLSRATFPRLGYVNLELADRREHATQDPRDFLRHYGTGVILDEIQRAPDLVSYIQEHVDTRGRNGLFVLTGSQQFTVTQAISQSLAGRTALLRLLPFSIAELARLRTARDTNALLYSGFYPRIHDQRLNPTQALGDYFETYVERDVRQISAIRNLSAFERFVRLCAGRVGQLLNLQSLGSDVGVSHTTAREWVSVLEASYIVFLLAPYHANVSKRLTKSPKLYFYDVGLASYLLGIEAPGQLATHPLRGSLFENLVVAEAMKHRFNLGLRCNMNFYRDSSGAEVDLVYQVADRMVAAEVKSGATLASDWWRPLDRFRNLFPQQVRERVLVYDGDWTGVRQGVEVTNVLGFASTLARLEERAGAPPRRPRRADA